MGYYNVGKMLVDVQGGEARAKYGDYIIKEYSKKLTQELGKGYSPMSLKNMRKFYLISKGQTLSVQISWSHYVELLRFNNIDIINYYVEIIKSENLSVRSLRDRIKNKEYERLSYDTKRKLINKEELSIGSLIKNPIIISNSYKNDKIDEKMLKELILRNMENFLEQLGQGFSFIKSEYKIKYGNDYNYIDLLLFNYIYNAFVVVELKVTKLEHSHIGQIKHYMNYVDSEVKSISHNRTIGIIICKQDNQFVVKYCSDERIFQTTYILT